MVLIDDPKQTVIEPLFEAALEKVYDFDLMQDGGSLKGWRVNQPELLEKVAGALAALAEKERFRQRYEVEDDEVMLYAMGDGNQLCHRKGDLGAA